MTIAPPAQETQPAWPSAGTRFAALDGLRAVAALTVLVYHLYPKAIPGGAVGVDVFFGISGFVITGLLLREHHDTGTIALRPFYRQRFRRLLPPLLLVAAFVVVWDGQWLAALLALTYVTNLVRAAQPAEYSGITGSLGHTWSLAIEEQFYLLWPLVLRFLLSRLGSRTLIGGIAALCLLPTVVRIALWNDQAAHRIYNGFDTRADQLLLGCLLALILGQVDSDRLRVWAARLAWPAAGLLALWAWQVPTTGRTAWMPVIYTVGFLGTGLLTVALLAGLVLHPGHPLGRVLAWRPLAWLGRRLSYGIYLWHYPLLALTATLGIPGRAAFVATATIAAAWLTSLLVERPLGRRARPCRTNIA